MVIHILVSSQMDYCNAIHTRLPLKSIWKLQSIWNAMASVLDICYTSCINVPRLGAIQNAGCHLQNPSCHRARIIERLPLSSGLYPTCLTQHKEHTVLQVPSIKEFHICSFWSRHLSPYHLRSDWLDLVSLLESAEGLAVFLGRKVRKLVKPGWFDIILWLLLFFNSLLLLWIVCCML